jgi:hypothetical protein
MDSGTHPFDVENFRLDAATARLGKGQHSADEVVPGRRIVPEKIREPRKRGHIKVPLAWYHLLADASGPTCLTAMRIAYLHWKGKGEPIKLANEALAEVGVSRNGKYRALRDLERRGLITVERTPRKSPIITVVGRVPNTA